MVDKNLVRRIKTRGKSPLPEKVADLLGDMSEAACSTWPRCLTQEMRRYRCFCCRAKDAIRA